MNFVARQLPVAAGKTSDTRSGRTCRAVAKANRDPARKPAASLIALRRSIGRPAATARQRHPMPANPLPNERAL
ncbi:hypothetical protein QM306_00810 [Burkholderia cenocepacia]|nr:hypothetical protein [Burkholderia cenocepacia]